MPVMAGESLDRRTPELASGTNPAAECCCLTLSTSSEVWLDRSELSGVYSHQRVPRSVPRPYEWGRDDVEGHHVNRHESSPPLRT